jgi:hypothetical protein
MHRVEEAVGMSRHKWVQLSWLRHVVWLQQAALWAATECYTLANQLCRLS